MRAGLLVEIVGQAITLNPPQRLCHLLIKTTDGVEVACVMHVTGQRYEDGTLSAIPVPSEAIGEESAEEYEAETESGLPEEMLRRFPRVAVLDLDALHEDYKRVGQVRPLIPGMAYDVQIVGDVLWGGTVVAR
jgi:hypothetical protein